MDQALKNKGGKAPFFAICGPCAIESPELCFEVAEHLAGVKQRLGLEIIFKASFDKANRTSLESFRGPGLEKGLEVLSEVKQRFGLKLISDIHQPDQAAPAAKVLDVLQIPAFLCRQTDLLVAAAQTGKTVNVKKGQFLAPHDVGPILGKLKGAGCKDIWLTERGASFGYNNLVVDMRSFGQMKQAGALTVMDATHSVQLPGGMGTSSGGDRRFVAPLARAAAAAGADAVFLEAHPRPDKALCDGPNSLPLAEVEGLLSVLLKIHALV